MSEDEWMDDAPPQPTKRTIPGSSSSNDDDFLKRLRMGTRELLNKAELNESKLGDQMKEIKSKVIKAQRMVQAKKTYKPSIEDKLLNTDIPYLSDNEIVQEFEYLSDEAWERVKRKMAWPIKDSSKNEDGSVEVDFKKLPDETKIAVMKIIHRDKKDKYGERRQKKLQFLDKGLEEKLHILEFDKNRTEERISQLQDYTRLFEFPDLPKETDSSDSEDDEDRRDWLDRSTNFGRAERQFY